MARTSAAAHAWRQSPEHRREAAPKVVGAAAAESGAAKCGADATCWHAWHSVHAAAVAASRDSVTAAAQLPASGADAEVHANTVKFLRNALPRARGAAQERGAYRRSAMASPALLSTADVASQFRNSTPRHAALGLSGADVNPLACEPSQSSVAAPVVLSPCVGG